MGKHKPNATSICQHCGKKFDYYFAPSRKGRRGFCSPTCRNKARIKDLTTTCPVCGKKFRAVSFGIIHGRKKTCSISCASQLRYSRLSKEQKQDLARRSFYRFKTANPNAFWNDDLDNMLMAYYPSMGAVWCAQRIGVSMRSIHSRANRLGVHLTEDAKKEIIHQAARVYMSGSGNPMKNPDVVNRVFQSIGEEKQREILEKLQAGHAAISRDKPSKLQLHLMELLEVNSIRADHEYLVKTNFYVDFAIPSRRIIIQADGCYWHGHECRFKQLSQRQKAQQARDAACDKYLTVCGWKVLRFWECEINKRPDRVIAYIIQTLTSSDN